MLDESPGAAREAASLAAEVLPGYAAPLVLAARANVRLQEFALALNAFQKARAIDPRSAEEPVALRDLALAQKHSGSIEAAAATYRILIPRLDLLPTTEDKALVLVEYAAISMSKHGDNLELGEAVATLSRARSLPPTRSSPIVLGLLALALDRASSTGEAAEVLDALRRSNSVSLLASLAPSSLDFLVDTNEWNAVIALAFEQENKAQAIATWERYIEGKPDEPYLAHARTHLGALRVSPARPSR